jgi:hypothetical protein
MCTSTCIQLYYLRCNQRCYNSFVQSASTKSSILAHTKTSLRPRIKLRCFPHYMRNQQRPAARCRGALFGNRRHTAFNARVESKPVSVFGCTAPIYSAVLVGNVNKCSHRRIMRSPPTAANKRHCTRNNGSSYSPSRSPRIAHHP